MTEYLAIVEEAEGKSTDEALEAAVAALVRVRLQSRRADDSGPRGIEVRLVREEEEKSDAEQSLDRAVNDFADSLAQAAGEKRANLYTTVVRHVERALIGRALKSCEGVQTRAARQLGMNRNTLHKKIIQLGLEPLVAAPGPAEARL